MKKLQNTLGILVILLLLFNAIIVIKYNNEKKKYQILMENFSVLSIKESRQSNTLKKFAIFQQNIESGLFPDIKLKEAKGKRIINFSSILKSNDPVLFFRFKETNCDACIQEAMIMLHEIPSSYSPSVKIVILCSYSNVRQFYAFANEEKEEFEVYNVDSLPLYIDKLENPYFFVMNQDMRIRNIFIPLKDDSQYTKDYLKCVTNKYWPQPM